MSEGLDKREGRAYHHDRVAEECVVEYGDCDDLHRILSFDGDTGEDGLPKADREYHLHLLWGRLTERDQR
jgi:hypothetical protein